VRGRGVSANYFALTALWEVEAVDLRESYYAQAARSGVRERLGRFAMDERAGTGALRVATLNI
jgi:hypothetical protein